MSLTFDPDSNAQPNVTWDTTFLSDRDVSAQIPINFVPHPGVHVTAACFGNQVYNDTETENCLSNLLYSQIRRYIIDVYWDTVNQRFGLCPVEIPGLAGNSSAAIATSEGSVTVNNSIETISLTRRQATPIFTSNVSESEPTATTTVLDPAFSVVSTHGSSQLIQLGSYQCSNTLTLASATSIFSDYLARTANTLDAKILVWILNLHVAAPSASPTQPHSELSAEELPSSDEGIATYLDNLDDILYKPGDLLSDRQNLNTSWFRRAAESELPLASYYNLFSNPNGDLATDDGWPNEDYIQVVEGKRMLIGFGDVDDIFSGYNFSSDGNRVFPPNYITSDQEVTFRDNGELSRGCLYNEDEFTVNDINNSWAVATINRINPPNLGNAADNLTTCGISQMLNVTIDEITADAQAGPYQSFGNNAIFSWAYGQPQNDTSVDAEEEDKFRCALMVSTEAYRGHWRVEYCSESYHAACRERDSPYRWTISKYKVPYDSGDAACTGNSTFDVPRTGLENRYLWNKIIADSRDDPSLLNGVWINFNSLDYQSCWVTTGVNGTCPYYQDSSATHSRQILIPTIAALIVLILTVLTILVKCSANARNSRIRRRGEGGWDYEGVPS